MSEATWTHCYVGREPCGCVVAVRVDTKNQYTANALAEFKRDGMTIERMTFAKFRKLEFGCKCGKQGAFPSPPAKEQP